MTWLHPRDAANGNEQRRCRSCSSRDWQHSTYRSCMFSFSDFRPWGPFRYKFRYRSDRPFIAVLNRWQWIFLRCHQLCLDTVAVHLRVWVLPSNRTCHRYSSSCKCPSLIEEAQYCCANRLTNSRYSWPILCPFNRNSTSWYSLWLLPVPLWSHYYR